MFNNRFLSVIAAVLVVSAGTFIPAQEDPDTAADASEQTARESKKASEETSDSSGQSETDKEKKAAEEGKKEKEKKLAQAVEKKLEEFKAQQKKKTTEDKKNITGYLKQLKSPLAQYRVLALNGIYGAYKEGKIKKRTAMLIFLDQAAYSSPRVYSTAFSKLRSITGKETENDLKKWEKWWEKQEKEKEEELKKKFREELEKEEKEGQKDSEKKTETAESKSDGETDEEDDEAQTEKARKRGEQKLLQQHNENLGHLDRIYLKNGREIECYIIRELTDDRGNVETYVIQFKNAIGKVEIDASEVDGSPEYDIDKQQEMLLVPYEEEEAPENE